MIPHLWQSTICVAVALLLTLVLRRDRASVRYRIWLAASVKFLVPFSLLVSAGSRFAWRTAPAVSFVMMDEIGRPFRLTVAAPPSGVATPASNPLLAILLAVWVSGCAIGVVSWLRCWRQIRGAQRTATPLNLNLPIPAMTSPTRMEPGVFGVFRPVLLLPAGITERLSPSQLDLILAHELCHVRRRDNLTGAIHMLVETIFWFHPLVWWIRARLIEERESACDEEVLTRTADPQTYAEGILNVCKFYLSSPPACASGVTGSDLRKRIEVIMMNRTARNLTAARKILLAAAAFAVVAGPVAMGVLGALPVSGQAPAVTAPRAFEAASVKPTQGRGGRTRTIEPGRITYLSTTLGELIAMAYGVKRYQISGPEWITNVSSSAAYDVVATAGSPVPPEEVKRMLGPLLAERFHLAFHRETRELPVFTLAVAKGGPKFKQPGDGGPASLAPDDEGGLFFQNWSVAALADWLSILPSLGRPVIDRTGVEGSYSFHANLFNFPKGIKPDEMKLAMVNGDASDAIASTLPQQLGLKLEAQKAPVEILVIDHADKVPTAN